MKTQDITQQWARKAALYAALFVGLFMAVVSMAMPFVDEIVKTFWFSTPNIYYLSVIPLTTAVLFAILFWDLSQNKCENRPFFLSIGLFLMGYLGLALSIYPWIIPFAYTLEQSAASNPGLSLMLVGVIPLLPIILGYTGYNYYVFRGKTSHEHLY